MRMFSISGSTDRFYFHMRWKFVLSIQQSRWTGSWYAWSRAMHAAAPMKYGRDMRWKMVLHDHKSLEMRWNRRIRCWRLFPALDFQAAVEINFSVNSLDNRLKSRPTVEYIAWTRRSRDQTSFFSRRNLLFSLYRLKETNNLIIYSYIC